MEFSIHWKQQQKKNKHLMTNLPNELCLCLYWRWKKEPFFTQIIEFKLQASIGKSIIIDTILHKYTYALSASNTIFIQINSIDTFQYKIHFLTTIPIDSGVSNCLLYVSNAQFFGIFVVEILREYKMFFRVDGNQ